MYPTRKTQVAWKALLIFLVLTTLLMGCGKGKSTKEEGPMEQKIADLGMDESAIVAKYKGGEIKAGEFEKYLHFLSFIYPTDTSITDSSYWPQILDSYIGQKVIVERATAKGIKINDEEAVNPFFNAKKDEISKSLSKGESFDEYLKKLGITEAEIKGYLRQYSMIDQYFITAKSDAELKEIYEKNPSLYTIATVRHILIDNKKRSDEEAKKLAEELADRIRKGEDFAALANEMTDDIGNTNADGSKNGGLYKDTPVTRWVEPFKNAALSLPLNQVSEPIKTEYGYHVMRVEKREVQPFEEVKEQIAYQEAAKAYEEFMKNELPGLIEERNLPKG